MFKFLKDLILFVLVFCIAFSVVVGLFGVSVFDYLYKGIGYFQDFIGVVLGWFNGFEGVLKMLGK
jgi:hypothetical protein